MGWTPETGNDVGRLYVDGEDISPTEGLTPLAADIAYRFVIHVDSALAGATLQLLALPPSVYTALDAPDDLLSADIARRFARPTRGSARDSDGAFPPVTAVVAIGGRATFRFEIALPDAPDFDVRQVRLGAYAPARGITLDRGGYGGLLCTL